VIGMPRITRRMHPDRGMVIVGGTVKDIKRVTSIPMLHDMEARVRMMEMWPGYQQVLTISNRSRHDMIIRYRFFARSCLASHHAPVPALSNAAEVKAKDCPRPGQSPYS
jgi:hypothetical protein